MTAQHLLDANALIALLVADHERDERAASWAADVESFATCPIVEGALLRFLFRVGESRATARALLVALHDSPRHEFWEDSLAFVHVPLDHVVGHRQVADAYLAALAASRGATLATFDQALATALPGSVLLIP